MRRYYKPDASTWRFASPSVLSALLGLATATAAVPLWILFSVCFRMLKSNALLHWPTCIVAIVATIVTGISVSSFVLAIGLHLIYTDADRIRYKIRGALCCSAYGNPLHLKSGDLLPTVTCKAVSPGKYLLKVAPGGTDIEAVCKLSSHISAALKNRYQDYAVVLSDIAVNLGYVTFTLENVTVSRTLTVSEVGELRPGGPTELVVQQGTSIDLTTSGSMLFSGKTRSGKTTAIISLLLQVLMAGRDDFGSEVIILDPKRAELSRLPHVITLDANGEATAILDALRRFCQTITDRQQVLNDLSEQRGDALHWWTADMHASFLFIDEYVACRTMFPTKAPKGNEDYCLATFDNLIKRILTMGSSSGCFAIVSIAEASVQEGGLPSMLRSAMSTKVLMRPTMPEARLLWPPEKLEALAASARVYGPGDAWFSSTDGVHDNVSYVHFPRMNFAVYRELGRLLKEYYGD